nr:PREDICTED: protein LYRIC-like [Struthio camelus australis]
MREVPGKWKTANVNPIFKKGNKEDVGNYRPISLTLILGKVMEQLILDMISRYVKDGKIHLYGSIDVSSMFFAKMNGKLKLMKFFIGEKKLEEPSNMMKVLFQVKDFFDSNEDGSLTSRVNHVQETEHIAVVSLLPPVQHWWIDRDQADGLYQAHWYEFWVLLSSPTSDQAVGDLVPVNGQLVTSASIREKKLLKPKRKKKAQCSEKGVSKDLLSVEKDRLQEEEGVWQTKISSREKRHLRKERLKQKEDPSRASRGNSVVEWEEKGTVWPRTASGAEDTSGRGKGSLVAKAECGTALKTSEESVPSWSEEDVFCNVGTWDIAEVKSRPVTFGTFSELSRELDNVKSKSSEDSPSRHCWKASAPFLTADDVWQGHDDPSAIDLDSDWKAPTEEWGNWTGDEEHQAGDEKEKDLPKGKEDIHFCLSGRESKTQRKRKKIEVKEARDRAGLMLSQEGWEARTKERPTELISTKHSSDTVGASFKIALDVANNTPNIDVPGKKERRKRKKMKKQT